MRPDIIGRDRVIGRQIFGPFTGRGDLEAARTRPIDEFADECGLVAVGERIDDARGSRLFGEQRPGEHVGFDVHHDDVFFGAYRRAGVGNARCRDAGRFDDHFGFGMCASLRA
jgi:hypothetical protein